MRFYKIILLFLVFSFSICLSGCTLDQTTKVEETKKYPSGIFKTINNGQVWDSKSFVKKTENRVISISDSLVYNIDFSPINNDMVVSTRNNGVYYSTNKGEQWNPLFTIGKNVKAFSFNPTSTASFYVGYQNKLYKTDNYGKDWKVIYSDPDSTIVSVRVDYMRSSDIYIFFADGRILKTEDGSSFKVVYNFINRPKDSDAVTHAYTTDSAKPYAIRDVYFYEKSATKFYIVTNDGKLYFTENGGSSFVEIGVDNNISGRVRFITFYPGATSSFIVATDVGIYRTFDMGDNFETIDILTNKNKNVTALAISPKNDEIIYYALGDLIYRTSNGGETWNTMPSPVSRTISTLKIDPENSNSIYLGSDVDGRLVEDTNNQNLFCELFGILFPQFCTKTSN